MKREDIERLIVQISTCEKGTIPFKCACDQLLVEFDRLKLKVAELEGKLWDAQDEPQQPDKTLEQKIRDALDRLGEGVFRNKAYLNLREDVLTEILAAIPQYQQPAIDLSKLENIICECGHSMQTHRDGDGCCDRSRCGCKQFAKKEDSQQSDKSLEQKIQRIFDDNTRDADCHEACIPREYYGEVILEILALLKPPQPRGYGEPKKESCSYCNRFDKCPVREFLFETKRSNKRCYFAEEFSCSNWQKQPEQEPSHWTPEGRYAAQTPCYGYNNPHQR